MKNYFYYMRRGMCASILALTLYGCQKEENIKVSKVKPEKIITNTSKILKLYKDTVYILQNTFVREAGEQLIIEEGTLIKAGIRSQTTPNLRNGGILIKPGGVILANGTSDQPIVFTSNAPAGSQTTNWEGITIQGKSTDNDISTPADAADFSGSLRYCRIEFAPLILKAVGSRTTIDNIMVSYTERDGLSAYNITGGTFNAKNLISYACVGPADYYITNGYTGKMQNVLAYRHPFFGNTGSAPVNTLTGIFIENNPRNPANAKPFTLPVISNLTVIGPNGQNGSTAIYNDTTIRASALVTTNSGCFNIRNSLFMGFPKAGWILDDSATANSIEIGLAILTHSIFQANDTARAFYLKPNSYLPYGSNDFKNFMLNPTRNNRLFYTVSDFSLQNIFNYSAPELLPGANSVVLKGAKFDGPFADASFFVPADHLGAFGKNDWTKGWTNFTPLKTNYNFPE
jgi:hypothetical protein